MPGLKSTQHTHKIYFVLGVKRILRIFEFEFATVKQTNILRANIFVKHDCACAYILRWRTSNVTKMDSVKFRRKERSVVWKHFKRRKTFSCGKTLVYHGGMSNLRSPSRPLLSMLEDCPPELTCVFTHGNSSC